MYHIVKKGERTEEMSCGCMINDITWQIQRGKKTFNSHNACFPRPVLKSICPQMIISHGVPPFSAALEIVAPNNHGSTLPLTVPRKTDKPQK